jgi:hypothetical protein
LAGAESECDKVELQDLVKQDPQPDRELKPMLILSEFKIEFTLPAPIEDNRHASSIHLSSYWSVSMSRNEEAKRDAERRVSDELANQPKQNGAGTEESKERRADAEKTLTDKKTEATTR